MLAVFSSTGGITGGEVAVAGGTAAVGQAMLSAVFGDQAVRGLVKQAAEDLKTRVNATAAAQGLTVLAALEGMPSHEDGKRLRTLARNVADEAHLAMAEQGGR